MLLAAIVSGWLTADLRTLQRLLSHRGEAPGSAVARCAEIADAIEAVNLLRENLHQGALLYKRRLLSGEHAGPVRALATRSAEDATERVIERPWGEIAVAAIGTVEPGANVAVVDEPDYASCFIFQVLAADPVRAFADAAFARRMIEGSATFDDMMSNIVTLHSCFGGRLKGIVIREGGRGNAITVEASEDGIHLGEACFAGDRANVLALGDAPALVHDLAAWRWSRASDLLQALTNDREADGLALVALPRHPTRHDVCPRNAEHSLVRANDDEPVRRKC